MVLSLFDVLLQVGTVAADVCCKMVETRTAHVPLSSSVTSAAATVWRDACRSIGQQYSRFDNLDGGRPVTSSGVNTTLDKLGAITSPLQYVSSLTIDSVVPGCLSTHLHLPPYICPTTGAVLLARGLPSTTSSDIRSARQPSDREPHAPSSQSSSAATEAYVKACGGRAAFVGGDGGGGGEGRAYGADLQELIWFRSSPCMLQGRSSGGEGSVTAKGAAGSRAVQSTGVISLDITGYRYMKHHVFHFNCIWFSRDSLAEASGNLPA